MTQRAYRIVALPGDGIGPEVMRVALEVLEAVSERLSWQVEIEQLALGAAQFQRTGIPLPDDVLAQCRQADAVLLAAIGLPEVRHPDGTEVQPDMMVGLRRALGLYAAIRPVRLYSGVVSPLRNVAAGIDLVIVRENLEGLFASYGQGMISDDQVATDTLVVTRAGTQRVVELAFRLARQRSGRPLDGRRMVTCVDKANVFRSFAFFRKVFFEVAAQFPDIAAEAAYVDAMSLHLIERPAHFDVLVMENQFGDILSDLGAAIVGGLGLAPSAEVGERHALFQPSHGTAPQLAGRNVANPLAMILSVAMMCQWLAEKHADPRAAQAGEAIHRAVERVLAERRCLTPDLGGQSSTQAVGQAVIQALSRPANIPA
jgi:3-isopropylmalate dehydrogenase